MSHSLEGCNGCNASDSGVGCSRFGSNLDGGEVLRVNLYLARCPPTARNDVISTLRLGDPGDLVTSSVRVGRGIDLRTINPVEGTKFLHGTSNRSSDEFASLVGFFGCESISKGYEGGDFALWGIVEDLGVSNLWRFFGLG